MAVPRRTRAHAYAHTNTHTLTTKRPVGVTKRTSKTMTKTTPQLAVRKQQQLQKSIQRFGKISKLAMRAGKEIIDDDICDLGVVEMDIGKNIKGEKTGDDGDDVDVMEEEKKEKGQKEEIGMIRSTEALVIETKPMEETSSSLPLRKRVRFAEGDIDGQGDQPQLRSVLVTGRKHTRFSDESQADSAKQEVRKRKRVTFDDDDDEIGKDDKSDVVKHSPSSDTAIQKIHSSICSSTSASSKSEAVYRAGISESLEDFQSSSKRRRNTLLSSNRLLAGQQYLNDLKTDAANAREKAGKAEKSLPKAFSIYQERQKLDEKENIAQPEQAADNDTDSSRAQNRNDVSTRNQSLLDRILAKQQWLAALPQAPSKAERERRTALHRAEEIVAMLTLLAGRERASGFGERQGNTSPRVSFPLQVLVKSVQGSMRSPMASEEVLKCLEVLEEEVGPAGFLRIVRTGGVCAVVVCPRLRPAMSELRDRVEEALAVDGKAREA